MVSVNPGPEYWFCTQFDWNLWSLDSFNNFSFFRAAEKSFLAEFCQLFFEF